MPVDSSYSDIIERLRANDRKTLAQCITLLESTAPAKQREAKSLLASFTGERHTLKLGITGPPGVGKSTFIEAMGLRAIDLGLKVCALTVDPSSPVSQGSILGDKTRMDQLSRHEQAYVRSSPSGNKLGGLSPRSYDVIKLCEQASFDIMFIESVGVGQSELDIDQVADITILLMQPASGDELQGIKKGIVEIADIIAVNKADGDLIHAARSTQKHYYNAAHIMPPRHDRWDRKVLRCSAETGIGLDEIWKQIHLWQTEFAEELPQMRQAQNLYWYERKAKQMVLDHIWAKAPISAAHANLQSEIKTQEITIYQALSQLQSILHDHF